MANWIIDRTINLDYDKTKRVLELLCEEPRKSDENLEVQLMQEGVLKNGSYGALRRRWYTYLRNYGLLSSDDVTEMGKKYANGSFSLKELSLLQMIKRQLKFENSTIYPFKIIVLLLDALKNRYGMDESYISQSEFSNNIVNMTSDSREDIYNLCNEIHNKRIDNSNESVKEGEHTDIWFNNLEKTGLFEQIGKCLFVREECQDFFEKIKTVYLIEKPNMSFTSFNFTLIELIERPFITDMQNGEYKRELLSLILYDYLFLGFSALKIQEKYIRNANVTSVKEYLSYAGLKLHQCNRGMYKSFIGYEGIIIEKLLSSGTEQEKYIAELLKPFKTNEPQELEIEQIENDDTEKKVMNERKPREVKMHSLNQILYGAPGTGKTYSTVEYAVAIIENREIKEEISTEERKELNKRYREYVQLGRIVFTTFHQNYSYEDFIEGLRPQPVDDKINFTYEDGVFKKIADKAREDNDNNYVIIIDEINRGNISKVFGELITLIEEDKRWGEVNQLPVTLPSGHNFVVPNNLYIIGTMNSADKSISLIDTALRRRFDFVEIDPNPGLIENEILRKVLLGINESLRKIKDSADLLVGHAYFMNKTDADLKNIMNKNIIPLLYEYTYDNELKIVEILNNALKDTVVSIDTENKQGRIRVK